MTTYAVTACVLLGRDDRWLLSVRGARVRYAPGALALIGGHVEPADHGGSVLEAAARRELLEETGVDLTGVSLTYLESVFIADDVPQVAVTFVARAPEHAAPTVREPAELDQVGWWTLADAERDPRCPVWLPGLLRRAAALVD